MSDIQDEAYSEAMEEIARKDAEIKRLRKVVEALEARHANEFNLLVRADDALSKWNVRNRFSDLIDELRKAAQ